MDKISTASDLSVKLRQKMERDSEENRSLILTEQEKLLTDLQSTYTSALDTTLNGIRESLKSRLGEMAMLTAQEAQTVEKMVDEHQQRLTKVMSSHYAKASKAIKSQTDPAAESLERLTASLDKATKAAEQSAKSSQRRWMMGLVVGLSALLIISGASWGLLQYLSNQIQQNLLTISQQQQTIKSLQDQTLGLEIMEAQNGVFLVLPPSAQAGFTVGGKSALRLQRH